MFYSRTTNQNKQTEAHKKKMNEIIKFAKSIACRPIKETKFMKNNKKKSEFHFYLRNKEFMHTLALTAKTLQK